MRLAFVPIVLSLIVVGFSSAPLTVSYAQGPLSAPLSPGAARPPSSGSAPAESPTGASWAWLFKDKGPGDLVLNLVSALLGATGGIWLKTRFEERSSNRRKRFEEELQRQTAMIDQQVSLLDDFGQAAGRFVSSAAKITFYSLVNDAASHEHRKRAIKAYHQDWDVFDQLRGAIRRTRRLCSESIYRELMAFYAEIEKVDMEVLEAAGRTTFDADQQSALGQLHHRVHQELPAEVDELLLKMAREMRLTPPNAPGRDDC